MLKKSIKNFQNIYSDLNLQAYFKHNLKYVYVILIAIIFFGFGFYFSNNLNSHNLKSLSAVAADTPISIPSILEDVKKELDTRFISWKATSTAPSPEDLNYGIIKGYVNAYNDPYTTFFSPSEAKLFTQTMQGSFGGIGAQVDYKDGRVIVSSPLKNSPAEKAGIKAGDIIVSVDGTSTLSMTTDQTVGLIRGEIGTVVKIEVLHKGDTKTTKLEIKRDVIKVPDMDTEILDDVFIIHFYSFTADSAQDFEKALQDFIKSGKTRLLVDLRGNGGGYLDSAINISSFFLPKDKVVLIEKGNKIDGDKTDYSKGFNYFNSNVLKMVILVDGYSASASEILAGALKDHDIATIVGEKTYGKGSVQQMQNFSDGSALKVTIAKWFTPDGVNISATGISPDIWATSTNATTSVKVGTTTKIIDMQLKNAIDILMNLK